MWFIYIAYSLYSVNYKKLLNYLSFYSKKLNTPRSLILLRSVEALFFYNTHPMDYFQFGFIEQNKSVMNEHANMLFMRRFHESLNKKKLQSIFKNKISFLERFKSFTYRKFFLITNNNKNEFISWIKNHDFDKLIIKKLKGTGGYAVKKVEIKDNYITIDKNILTLEDFFYYCNKSDYLLLEEYVVQHKELMKWNPNCLNTVRIVTVIDKEKKVHMIGAVIRVGVDADVDNFHSGGIAVNVNVDTGKLEENGFRLDPEEKSDFISHPNSGVVFNGLQIPYWHETLNLVKEAANVVPEVRTVGWDIAISEKGPELIEGNDNWDKIIIEKGLRKGIKSYLSQFLN